MVKKVPSVDTRRRSELYQQILSTADIMLPDWHGDDLGQEGDYLTALFKIAAQMQENITVAIDGTPERDQLEFFNLLDLPVDWPRPATAPVAFILNDKQTAPVFAKAGTQVAANTDDGEVVFETEEALAISPTRLTFIAAVDGDEDWIELPPPGFLDLVAPEEVLPQFQAASFSGKGSKIIQIEPLGGLETGDVIRIGNTAYHIAEQDETVFELEQPLEADVNENQVIKKVDEFDTYTLRNQQEHYFYISHSELFNLEQPAIIYIDIDPAEAVDTLKTGKVEWQLYGILDGEEDPRWISLTIDENEATRLKLIKNWQGTVEKLEINNEKTLWLRAEYKEKISDARVEGTRINKIKIAVESADENSALATTSAESCDCLSGRNTLNASAETDAEAETEESTQGVTQAFHNGTPLPLTTRFLPFGPEPNRFDVFSVAMPEVLSKKGAEATLHVTLPDASIQRVALAQISTGHERAYGTSSNGAIQALLFANDLSVVDWEEIDPPQLEDLRADDEGASASQLQMNNEIAPVAVQDPYNPSRKDLVVSRDVRGAWWALQLDIPSSGDKRFTNPNWRQISLPITDEMSDDFIVLTHANTLISPVIFAPLVTIIDNKLQFTFIGYNLTVGNFDFIEFSVSSGSPQPNLDNTCRVFQIQQQNWADLQTDLPFEFMVLDLDQQFWIASYNGYYNLTWQQVAVAGLPGISLNVRPAAIRTDTGIVIFAADDSLSPFSLNLSTNTLIQTTGFTVQSGTSMSVQPRALYNAPVAVAFGTETGRSSMLVMTGSSSAYTSILLPEPRPESPTVNDGFVYINQDMPEVVSNVADERISRTRIAEQIQYENYHVLITPAVVTAQYIEPAMQSGSAFLPFAPLKILNVGNDVFHVLAPGFASANVAAGMWNFWNSTGSFQGTSANSGMEITLPASHGIPAAGASLLINGERYVATLNTSGANPIAELDRSTGLSDGDNVTYDVLEPATPINQTLVNPNQLNTLLKITSGNRPAENTVLFFDDVAPINQSKQVLESINDSVEEWVLLDSAWANPNLPPTNLTALFLEQVATPWVTSAFPRGYQNPELAWEYYDGGSWRRLEQGFEDKTNQLASTGNISFVVPDDIEPAEVAGQEDYWIRARLIGGDYGQAEYIVTQNTNGNTSTQTVEVNTENLNPPEILRLEASFKLSNSVPAEVILIKNNLGYSNQTQASQVDQAQFELFEGVRSINDAGIQRVIYFGFNKRFDVGQIAFYVDAQDQLMDVPLDFEILMEDGWRRVSSADKTQGFHRRGFIQVVIEFAPRFARLFGRDAYWLRARPRISVEGWAPKLRGVFINAVPVEQVQSRAQEILGSSTGEKAQVFPLSQKPVLPQNFELRVKENLTAEEHEALLEDNTQAITQYPDLSIDGDWVLWQAVDSFVGYTAEDRVYKLDSNLGEISFGTHTKTPPPGRNNIRVIRYQVGGGIVGNLDAYKIENVKSDVPGVETLANPIASSGGTEPPELAKQILGAPSRIRHTGLALTPADIESICVASSPLIVRARCLFPENDNQKIHIAIAFADDDECPQPSLETRQSLENEIRSRAWGALNEDAIEVVGPEYVEISLDLTLQATDLSVAVELEQQARKALAYLLNPIIGGPENNGWPFARRVWQSDILRCLAAIPSFDRVLGDIDIKTVNSHQDLDNMPAFGLICARNKNINVRANLDSSGGTH